jgi:hypothetical protein
MEVIEVNPQFTPLARESWKEWNTSPGSYPGEELECANVHFE